MVRGQRTEDSRGRRRDSQVEELVEDRVQRLQLDLCALTLGHGEEVVGAELHDDERVAQTCGGQTDRRTDAGTDGWAGGSETKFKPPNGCNSTVSIQRHDVGSVQDLHRQPLLRGVIVALDADAPVAGVFERFLKHSHRQGGFNRRRSQQASCLRTSESPTWWEIFSR